MLYQLNAYSLNIGLNKDRKNCFITAARKKNVFERKRFSEIEVSNVLFRNDFVLINGAIGCVMEFRKNVLMTAPVSKFKHESDHALVSEDVLVRAQLYKLVKADNGTFSIMTNDFTFVNLIPIKQYTTHLPTPLFEDGNMYYSAEHGALIESLLLEQMDCD